MSRGLRNSIIKHLETKGNYSPDVDDHVIDMLIDNIKYADEMKLNLDTNGCVLKERSGNNVIVTKMNPAFGVYQMCQRNIHQAASKLGISRKDRIALKLIEAVKEDDFDD